MIEEIYKVPEHEEWSMDTARDLNKVLSYLHKQAVTVEYMTAAPSKMGYGNLVIVDDGSATQRIYFKTGSNTAGTISYADQNSTISGGTAGQYLISQGGSDPIFNDFVLDTRTADPASPSTGQIWIRTDI